MNYNTKCAIVERITGGGPCQAEQLGRWEGKNYLTPFVPTEIANAMLGSNHSLQSAHQKTRQAATVVSYSGLDEKMTLLES